MPSRISIRPADWTRMGELLLGVRRRVFCEEQGVPEAVEIDGKDPRCRHVAAVDDETGHVIGTGRMIIDDRAAHLGRVAVLPAYRNQGLGRRLVRFLLDDARRLGLTEAHLHAQTSAIAFYESLGFTPHGPQFLEAAIPHIAMSQPLTPIPPVPPVPPTPQAGPER